MSVSAAFQGNFSFPTRVVFGPGRVEELPALVAGWGKRALIVSDQGVIRNGVADPVFDALKASDLDYGVFEGIEPNPTEANIEAGVRRYREGNHDFIIAVGGGSAIDGAKAIRLLATHEPPLSQYDDLIDGSQFIRDDLPSLVAVPTTAGTGSEVGRSTVITIGSRKTVLFSPHLIPTIALCDPNLTLDMPRAVTAGTGADALTHNVEAYFSIGFNPLCDGIALDGMRRAAHFLPIAYEHGHNLEARSEMMAAALMGAVAFQKGLGVVHSLAHPLSSLAGVHHGTANALLLPYAIRFNAEAIADRIIPAAQALGVDDSGPGEAVVERIAEHLEVLFANLELPSKLRDLNVTRGMIEPMAALAIQDGCHLSNPRPVSEAEMVSLYEAAF